MPKGKPSSKWKWFDEEANAIDYLFKAHQALAYVDSDPTQWKWVILCLHGALYSFAVCAIKGTDWTQVTVETDGAHRLISFAETIERCQSSEWMERLMGSKRLVLTEDQREAILWFDKYRNRFERYVPGGWGIELHDLPVFTLQVLDVVRFLALECGNIRLGDHDRKRIEGWIARDKSRLQGTQLYKDYLAARKRHAQQSP